jgi:DNA replication protein DnaC
MKNELTEKIKELTKEVRLPGVRKYLTEEITQANLKNLPYEEFLYSLLLKEYDLRLESGKKNRIRLADFPYRKYLEDLSVCDLPTDAQRRLKVLKSLDFIEQVQNVILAGSPGTGKTHLAIGLGIKACLSGYKVLFVTIPLLINQLKESRSQGSLDGGQV